MPSLNLPSIVRRGMSSQSKSSKRSILDFTDQAGMVYFGYVSQRDDDHHIVRGMTVSTKHHDDHYCIGTYESYDVVFVERSDTLLTGKKHQWHIMEFDLHTKSDLPHSFIGSGRHGNGFHELLSLKYPNLQPLQLGATAVYPDEFISKFNVYTTPAHAIGFELIIHPEAAATMGSHFDGLVVELTDQALYIYSEKPHVSSELLMTMLKNGAWLANQIDQNSRSL